MPETDNPLKMLVRDFAPDFAAWLLNVEPGAVQSVRALNIELPAGAVRSDTVFYVILAEGGEVLLHIEFQGESSEPPLPWRMLDYLSRLAQRELNWLHLARIPVCSAVLYVGDGAGRHDHGDYRVGCPDGGLTLAWRYRVLRLWQMPAEELLALGRPALMTLLGQTRLDRPELAVAQALAAIRQVPDLAARSRMFGALVSLMRDEEVLTMTERLLETIERDPLLNTPFLRRIRAEGLAAGAAEGEARGEAKGLVEAVLDVLLSRLNLAAPTYRRLERRLAAISDLDRLRELLLAALHAADVAEFERALGE